MSVCIKTLSLVEIKNLLCRLRRLIAHPSNFYAVCVCHLTYLFFQTIPCVRVFSMLLGDKSLSNVAVFCRYESPEIALNCGIMLRECIRHEPLAKITLWSEQFYDFFRYVEMSTFDIASDAFATFKVSCSADFLWWVLWNICDSFAREFKSIISKVTH